MISRLTEQQEKFAQHYAIFGRPSQAYRAAYNCENSQPQTIYTHASQLLNNDKVALRIYELQQIAAEEFKVDVRKKKALLMQIAEGSTQTYVNKDGETVVTGDLKAAIAAIAELNKMEGDHAAQRKEITGKNGAPIETRQMEPEEYKKARDEMLKNDDC